MKILVNLLLNYMLDVFLNLIVLHVLFSLYITTKSKTFANPYITTISFLQQVK